MADNFTQLVTGITLGRAALVQSLVQAPANAADGSAAAPGLSFSGDQTTGIARIGGVPQVVQSGTAVQTLGERLSVSAFFDALGGTDWAAAVQAAHNYAASHGLAGAILELPANANMAWASVVTITTPIHLVGQGIGASRFLISTSLSTTGYLIVNATTSNEVQVHFEGFTALFIQPDVSVQASLTQYPPFFYIDATPRVRFDRIRISCGWRGIAFYGNCGGAEVNWLQTSCLYKNVEIDGCESTMALFRCEFYPFDLSTNQQEIFYSSALTGLYSGRCDNIQVIACLFYCGSNSAVDLFAGATGSTFGAFTACDFDNFGALNMSAGEVNVVGCSFTLGDSVSSAILLSGGDLNVTGTIVLCSTKPANNAIIAMSGGNLSTAGLTIKKAVDTQALLMSGGTILGSFTIVEPDLTTVYANSLLYLTGGTGIIETNVSPHEVAAGRPGISIVGNNAFVLRGEINNRTINCSVTPTEADLDISGLTNPIVADQVVGPLRTLVMGAQIIASGGTLQVAHGVAQGLLKVIQAQAFYETASGLAAPMALVSIDGTNLNFSGGVAGQPAKVVFQYTDFPTNW